MQMVSVAFQSDVSPGESGKFLLVHKEIPEDKQGKPELSSVSTEHFSANHVTPCTVRFDWNRPGLESTSMTSKLQIQA